jgi:membrane fusion protein (multidrug efflux system)
MERRVAAASSILLSFCLLLGSCSEVSEAENQTEFREQDEAPILPKMPVAVAEVRREDVTETLDLTGTVRPWDAFSISSEIMGTVVAIHCDEGDWIAKGDLLLELDRRKLELQLKSRKADLQRAQVELEFASKRLQRGNALLAKGAISQSDVDTLDEGVELAISKVEVSKLAVESTEEDLLDTRIFAPTAGQISRRHVSLGEAVNPAAVLFELIQLQPIKVITEITEPYLADVRTAQKVDLEFDAFPGKPFSGSVYKVQPVANVDSGAFPLEIRLPNQDQRLQAGMIARVRLRGKVFDEVLVVPLESVVNTQGKNYVFVVTGGLAYRKLVEVKERVGNLAIVDADLEPGQRVVVRGNTNLTDGTPVELDV